ncbi:MAG: hypothetical protein VYB55_02235, partial [Bacteroidota bacterium]|nr:hypothetical protein [Bacteroidota bacterium]
MIKIRKTFKLYIGLLLCTFSLNAQNPFIENKGQLPKQVKAKVVLPSGSLFIEQGKLIYAFYSGEQLAAVHDLSAPSKNIDAHSYIVEFVNSNSDILTRLSEESKYYENYFLGDQSKWAAGVKSHKFLYQKNVYNGIDLQYYVDKDKLKYDIIIAPNANIKQI